MSHDSRFPVTNDRMPDLVIAGYPGSGKSTLANLLQRAYGYKSISGSDILREKYQLINRDSKPPTAKHGYLDFWKEQAELKGSNWLAQAFVQKTIRSADPVIYDGVRIYDDFHYLTHVHNFNAVGIILPNLSELASRIQRRNRIDDQEMDNIERVIEIENGWGGSPFAVDRILSLCVKKIATPLVPAEDLSSQCPTRQQDLVESAYRDLVDNKLFRFEDAQ